MKLLIVDDSLVIRSTIERNARHAEIREIFQAENGEAALELYHCHQPELMTLDLTMPKVDGLECLAQIQKLGGGTAILVVSALNSHRTAMEAVALGACGFLIKPFTPAELSGAIDQLVAHHKNKGEEN